MPAVIYQGRKLMHILVTNDDGIYAPGIAALAKALRMIPDAKITVVASAENQSAVGHRKTLRDILRMRPITLPDGSTGHATSGSPADAVALAVLGYIKEPIDLVVSGINQGANLAQDITYSGTVTAAMEASISRIPAIAVSLDSHTEPEFETAAAFAARLAPIVYQRGLPELTLLNVNVPLGAIKGVKITRQGHRIYRDELVERLDPMGRPYFWIGGDYPTGDMEEAGTDVWAVNQGYISITPIRMDMTDEALMRQIEGWEVGF
jgi:5'-nucleotidase